MADGLGQRGRALRPARSDSPATVCALAHRPILGASAGQAEERGLLGQSGGVTMPKGHPEGGLIACTGIAANGGHMPCTPPAPHVVGASVGLFVGTLAYHQTSPSFLFAVTAVWAHISPARAASWAWHHVGFFSRRPMAPHMPGLWVFGEASRGHRPLLPEITTSLKSPKPQY